MIDCGRDCFNCVHDDCVTDNITPEERLEIDERNNLLKHHSEKYWKNPQSYRDSAKKYYYNNLEKSRAKNKVYYNLHKKKMQELNKRWKEEHKELVRERQHQYYLNWKRKKELNGQNNN